MSLLGALEKKYKDQKIRLATSIDKAKEWFSKKVAVITGNQIMSVDRKRLVPRGQLTVRSIGRLYLFFYDPKLKETLPYYDRFPLMIPIKFYKDGFLGLNLHYLPYDLRAKFMDGLYEIYSNKYLDENKKLNLTYARLKGVSRLRYFKPCIKRYLWTTPTGGGVKSQFYQVDPEEWEMVLMLPIERFEKKSKSFVWNESRKMLGKSNK